MKPKIKKGQPKIPAQRINSDDCVINIGQVIQDGEVINEGQPYYVHDGEWVEILPVMTIREVTQLSRLQQAASDVGALGENLTTLCHELAQRVLAWSWTDMMGEPMEQPYKRSEVLEALSSEELLWLVNATAGQEAPEDRKKDSAESVDTF